jgi:hypothetical protein
MASDPNRGDDALGAARGLLIGLGLGALCWSAIALAVWVAS